MVGTNNGAFTDAHLGFDKRFWSGFIKAPLKKTCTTLKAYIHPGGTPEGLYKAMVQVKFFQYAKYTFSISRALLSCSC